MQDNGQIILEGEPDELALPTGTSNKRMSHKHLEVH